MSETSPAKRYQEVQWRRELLDTDITSPELAIKAHFAQQFGHVVIRHANNEISTSDRDQLHDLYVSKVGFHSMVDDRALIKRDFDYWVDAMYPAALADIYDAKADLETDELPAFKLPEAGVNPNLSKEDAPNLSKEDALLIKNLELATKLAESEGLVARLMNDSVRMRRRLNAVSAELAELQESQDSVAHGAVNQ